jgi:KaiC/GvpD/RAD55 family RecA-like ATPase
VNAVSSLADIWIDIKSEKKNVERVRRLRIVKSRGMGHATEAQNFVITGKGILIGEPDKKIKINYNGNRRTEKV